MTLEVTTLNEATIFSLINSGMLPDDPELLKQLLNLLLQMLSKETKRREEVERSMDALLKQLRRSKSTQSSPGQLPLFDATAGAEEEPAIPATLPGEENNDSGKPTKRTCRPHGRRGPADNLEQIEMVHDFPDEVKSLCPGTLIPLPDVITYQYDYQPGKCVVIRHIQKKYAVGNPPMDGPTDGQPSGSIEEAAPVAPVIPTATQTDSPDSETELVTPATPVAPSEPVDVEAIASSGEAVSQLFDSPVIVAPKKVAMASCLAASGLLAFIWLSKFGDHLPLYRQESITKRWGIHFARSTLCDWMLQLAFALDELYQLLIAEVLRSRVLHTDDTTVKRQDPQTNKLSTARFWNYVGDEEHPLTAFQFTLTHERIHPATFLADYQGYLQADAYNGYDGIYLGSQERIVEVGCWYHARKRFKAAIASDIRATVGIAFIKQIYAIEAKLRQRKKEEWAGQTVDEVAAHVAEVRTKETVPILQAFGQWLRQMYGQVTPKSDFADAIRYTLNQWDALNCFTTCGLLDPDNNEAERGHRGIAIGRKNWRAPDVLSRTSGRVVGSGCLVGNVLRTVAV